MRRPDKHFAAVVNRAAYLLPEDLKASHRLVLESLRRHRNAGVHKGLLPGDARDLLRQLRRYVVVGIYPATSLQI